MASSSAVAQEGPFLTAAEVQQVIAQAAAELQGNGRAGWIAVTDADGHVLGVYRMNGAPSGVVIQGLPDRGSGPVCGPEGLEGARFGAGGLPNSSPGLIAISKAGTGAFLSSGSTNPVDAGHAFSSRTASFIVQEHFPPKVELTPGGPLFGVQFSSLVCTDFKAITESLPVGLSGDPGGVPLFKNGALAGGVGVEADGSYGVDRDPKTEADDDPLFGGDASLEERAALAGTRGFESPDELRADRILADGIRLPLVNFDIPASRAAVLPPGAFDPVVVNIAGVGGVPLAPAVPRAGFASNEYTPITLGGVRGRTSVVFPIRNGAGGLTASEVTTILTQAAQQTARTRAAIRRPLDSNCRVSVAVVDTNGDVLGFFQNDKAPNFGMDVAVQKARTANFFSSADAGAVLRSMGLSRYIAADVPLDGSRAYTSRAVGFLAQPFFPPGFPDPEDNHGPFSVAYEKSGGDGTIWSPFNTGLQLDLLCPALQGLLGANPGVLGIDSRLGPGIHTTGCSTERRLRNGITIFPGGVPLFKGGRLVGAIGISGDGIDQDDLISSAGSAGFEAPEAIRADQLVIRDVRLPWVKFPRHPELP